MNILIIEDEYLTAERIKKIIEEISSEFRVIEIIRSVKQGKAWFKDNPEPDLIFSDIELGDGKCFEIFAEHQPQAPIIFLTAYKEYAMHAFKLNSIDYLLKPIRKSDVIKSIDKLKSLIINNLNNPLIKLNADYSANSQVDELRFLIKQGVNLIPITASDIILFYADSNLTYIITKDNSKYIIDSSLEYLETILDPKHYFRISRGLIIADYGVVKIKTYELKKVKIELIVDIPLDLVVSRRKVSAFKTWLEKTISN
ncbi:MAG: LytTR family DNA-binding domain-containing protein [Candidatus Cloacimonadales bacterium]